MEIIHKISFNNTYVACTHLAEHKCQLLVCIKCGKKIEFSSSEVFEALKLSSEKQGFLLQICYNPYETGIFLTFYITKTKL